MCFLRPAYGLPDSDLHSFQESKDGSHPAHRGEEEPLNHRSLTEHSEEAPEN